MFLLRLTTIGLLFSMFILLENNRYFILLPSEKHIVFKLNILSLLMAFLLDMTDYWYLRKISKKGYIITILQARKLRKQKLNLKKVFHKNNLELVPDIEIQKDYDLLKRFI